MSSKPLPVPVKKSPRLAKTPRPVFSPEPSLRLLHFTPRLRNRYLRWKRAMDFCFAFLLLVLAAPVVALTALLVKWTSPGPAFYTQRRLGLRGVEARLLNGGLAGMDGDELCNGLIHWDKAIVSRIASIVDGKTMNTGCRRDS